MVEKNCAERWKGEEGQCVEDEKWMDVVSVFQSV